MNKLSRFEIFPNDILMTCAGTLGKISLVPYVIERGMINSVLTLFRVNTSVILPEYFKIVMKSELIQYELVETAIGTGIKNMRPIAEVKNLLIPLPTIPEQEKIVVEFSKAVDELKKIEEELRKREKIITKFDILN